MNILKIQDTLKNLSDEQLAQEMRLPSGTAPQYLVMTEMQRRQKMRDEFSGSQPPKTTMAEEMSGEVPPQPENPSAGGQPAATGQAETAPPQEANAQGLMGLPDQTMAGNAMRAKITGQPQQVDNMTAMPPQGMAAGGAVQFGDPFAGATMGTAARQSTGYAPIQQYMPTPRAPETTNDFSNFRHQFDGKGTPHTPNPRVHMSDAQRYGLPAGMAAPRYGSTPGLVRSYTGKDDQRVHYSWANDAARDAYIKSMTPAATTTTPAAVPVTATVVTKAGGGPIRMGAGALVNYGGPEQTGAEDFFNSLGTDLPTFISMLPPESREVTIKSMLSRNNLTNLNPAGNPQYEKEVRSYLEGVLEKDKFDRQMGENLPPIFGSTFTPRGEVERRARAYEEARNNRDRVPLIVPSLDAPSQPIAANPEAPQTGSPTNAPAQLDANQSYNLDAPAPSLLPSGELPAPKNDYASLGMMPQQKGTPPSAAISGLPSIPAMPNIRPSDGGIASLPKAQKDTSYEDYMKQANALLSEAAGDPKADKDRSFNNALMKLGLGMAASKNQSLLGAVAEGGLPALQQYTEDEAQRRKDARAMAGEKLTVLGAGMQMRQAAEKDYRDQMTKAEELRLRGREADAKILADQANAAYQMASLQIRGWEAQNTAQHQADVLEETRRSNKASEEKLPETVRALQAEHGDKWQTALKVQVLQDNLEKYNGAYKAALAANSMEDAKTFKALFDGASASLEKAMEELYGTGSAGGSAVPNKPLPTGSQIIR